MEQATEGRLPQPIGWLLTVGLALTGGLFAGCTQSQEKFVDDYTVLRPYVVAPVYASGDIPEAVAGGGHATRRPMMEEVSDHE